MCRRSWCAPRCRTTSDHGGWVTNGGGFHFNPRYGAGLVNASAATAMAATWTNVAALQTRVISQTNLAQAIPDADETGISRTLTVAAADNLRLEHVTVKVKATYLVRRQPGVEAHLTQRSQHGLGSLPVQRQFGGSGLDLYDDPLLGRAFPGRLET